MRLGAYYAVLEPGQPGRRGLRRAGRERAPSPPLRVQPEQYRARFEEAGLWCSRHVARPPAGRVHRAAAITRSGSAPRPIPSSRAAPTGRTRCSASSSPRHWPASTPVGRRADRAGRRAPVEVDQPHDRRLSARSDGVVETGWSTRATSGASSSPTSRTLTASGSSATSCARPARSAVVPLVFDAEGNPSVVLVAQYRPPYDRAILEIPAGMRDVDGRADRGDRRAAS